MEISGAHLKSECKAEKRNIVSNSQVDRSEPRMVSLTDLRDNVMENP